MAIRQTRPLVLKYEHPEDLAVEDPHTLLFVEGVGVGHIQHCCDGTYSICRHTVDDNGDLNGIVYERDGILSYYLAISEANAIFCDRTVN